MKKILIGIDDSKFAEHAVAYGFDLAHQLKARVGLVHIVEPTIPIASVDSGMGFMDGSSPNNIITTDILNMQNQRAEDMITSIIKKYGKGSVVKHFKEYGDTADGILNCSKAFNADMIVIGTHSRSGIDRLLMGSVAEHVVRNAEIPVLVVPMKSKE